MDQLDCETQRLNSYEEKTNEENGDEIGAKLPMGRRGSMRAMQK